MVGRKGNNQWNQHQPDQRTIHWAYQKSLSPHVWRLWCRCVGWRNQHHYKNRPMASLSLLAYMKTVGKEYGIQSGIHNESLSAAYTRNKFTSGTGLNPELLWWLAERCRRPRQNNGIQNAIPCWCAYRLHGWETQLYYRADYLFENIFNREHLLAVKRLTSGTTQTRLMQQLQCFPFLQERKPMHC